MQLATSSLGIFRNSVTVARHLSSSSLHSSLSFALKYSIWMRIRVSYVLMLVPVRCCSTFDGYMMGSIRVSFGLSYGIPLSFSRSFLQDEGIVDTEIGLVRWQWILPSSFVFLFQIADNCFAICGLLHGVIVHSFLKMNSRIGDPVRDDLHWLGIIEHDILKMYRIL